MRLRHFFLFVCVVRASGAEWPLRGEPRGVLSNRTFHMSAAVTARKDTCNPGNTVLSTPDGNVQYFGWWAGSDGHGMGLAYSNVYFDSSSLPGAFLHPASPLWNAQCGNGKLKCMPRLDDYWNNFDDGVKQVEADEATEK